MTTVKSAWATGNGLLVEDSKVTPEVEVVVTVVNRRGDRGANATVNRQELIRALLPRREGEPTMVETRIEHWKERAEKAEAEADRLRADLYVARTAFEDRNASMLAAMDERDAVRAERDRLLATIERIDAVRRDFYEVRGDWADPEGAAALKAQMERAILGDPPFELPTKAWSGIVGEHIELGEMELRLFPDGKWVHVEENACVQHYLRWCPDAVLESFTGLRLVED